MRALKWVWPTTCAVLGGCATAAPQYRAANVPAYAPIAVSNGFVARIVAAHNRERATAGVPPLEWDGALEAGAASYARGLAMTSTFAHSNRAARPGIGENLWMGTRGAYGLEQMIATWASERRMFVPGIFPRISRDGNWEAVGHYSQMIWPTTTRVGCALATNRSRDYLVCRYAPAGNIDGRRVP